jgi:CDP-diacylglycerol--glycerol-3-phosphate 3-phosphatidyltransferase
LTAFRATLQHQTRRTAERLVAPLARIGVTPNGLTIFGLLLNAVAALLLAMGAFLPGALMVLFAGAFDMFDGALARATNRKTDFGAFSDSTVDRYSEAVVFLGLLVAFLRQVGQAGGQAGGDWLPLAGVVLCYVAAIGSLMVSYTRARAEGPPVSLNAEVGWLQRPERIVILGIGLLLPAPWLLAVLAALAVLTQVTVVQRVLHVRRLTAARGG